MFSFASHHSVHQGSNPWTVDSLQEDITELQEWSKKWQLQFNEERYKVLHLGKIFPVHQQHMGNTSLSTAEAEVDLGVHVTRLPLKVKSMPNAADRFISES